jgi:hypothetical protein
MGSQPIFSNRKALRSGGRKKPQDLVKICPFCEQVFRKIQGGVPDPGDFLVCNSCAAILVVEADGEVTIPIPRDFEKTSQETLLTLRSLQQQVQQEMQKRLTVM